MRIEVDHCNWAICTIHGSEQWESDSVITTKSNQTRQSLALLGWTDSFGIRFGRSGEQRVMPFFDLFQGIGVIITVAGIEPLAFPMECKLKTHEVTGISPQSTTVAQELKGLASRGTL